MMDINKLKEKLTSISICMILITTTVASTVRANEKQEISYQKISEKDYFEYDNEETTVSDPWIECMTAFTAIRG
jgi:hypothetical protein